jgi:two-component system nitrogen regulation sensor histidine kinase GlnL
LGQPAAFLFDRDKALAHSIQQACRGEVADCRQFARVRRGLETVEVAVTSVALSQPLWSALIEIKDLEQRVLADRSSRLVDEIDTQHELLRNLAHEVKNPLGGLRGAAQLLESELPDPALREYTSVIISEADRLQALVDRLAAPQRMPVQWQAVNIHEICERVCALVRAEFREVALLRDYDASMPEFRADPARVMQALLNIVRNAAQIMTGFHPTQSPHITIKTRIARQVLLRHKQHRLAAVVTVTDNGPGVPQSLKERIFHPLVTGRDGGTGLGLSLAQDFIQQHGGVIEFESQPGHTEFRLQLPMEPL